MRAYRTKTSQRRSSGELEESYRRAIKKVLRDSYSVRQASAIHGVSRSALARYIRALNLGKEVDFKARQNKNRIFTDAQEKSMESFLLKSSRLFYGLSIEECRRLFFEMAVHNNIPVPASWKTNETAGEDFYYGFLKRYPHLSLRTPESCSLGRSTGFNKHKKKVFFDNLKKVMERHPTFLNGTRVFNLDEHGETVVHKPRKVIAKRGTKQVSQATSAERGKLVTICAIVCATGTFIPPAIVFPRKNFKNHMLNGAPPGSLGLATETGWMDAQNFNLVLRHLVHHTKPSKKNPVLLIFDNHESHISYENLCYAKENHITIVTIPPHTSHKLQPLDKTNFYPFTVHYSKELGKWMKLHPGKPASIYEIADFMGKAFDASMTPSLIKSGFRSTGIFPFNPDIFTDEDFEASEVTDRPYESTTDSLAADNAKKAPCQCTTKPAGPSSSMSSEKNNGIVHLQEESITSKNKPVVSAEKKAPCAKKGGASVSFKQSTCHFSKSGGCAGPLMSRSTERSGNNKNRNEASCSGIQKQALGAERHGLKRSMEADEPPEALNAELIPETAKRSRFEGPEIFRRLPKAGPRVNNRKPRRKGKSMIATDSPELNEIKNRKFGLPIEIVTEKNDMDVEKESKFNFESTDIEEGDFFIFEVKSKNNFHLIGKVIKECDNNIIGFSCLRRSEKVRDAFVIPPVPDLRYIHIDEIKTLLSKPTSLGSTKRQQSFYRFTDTLSGYNIY